MLIRRDDFKAAKFATSLKKHASSQDHLYLDPLDEEMVTKQIEEANN